MRHLNEVRPLSPRGRWDVEDMFDRVFAPMMLHAGSGRTAWSPGTDIVEKPEEYVITADVAGVDPEDVNITISGDTITISGERKMAETAEGDHRHVSERVYGSFERTFSFPTPVSEDDVEASTRNGVVTIRVPKASRSKPRRIAVKAT